MSLEGTITEPFSEHRTVLENLNRSQPHSPQILIQTKMQTMA